jgi:hypothetical protein
VDLSNDISTQGAQIHLMARRDYLNSRDTKHNFPSYLIGILSHIRLWQ